MSEWETVGASSGSEWETVTSKDVIKTPTTKEKPSAIGAFTSHAAAGAIPAVAGYGGWVAGAEAGAGLGGMAAGPVGAAVGGIVGGIAGALGASFGAEKIQEAVLPEAATKYLSEAEKAHPTASFAGGVASQAAALRPGVSSMKAAGVGAAVGGGLEAGKELATEGKIDVTKTALAAVGGAAFTKPTALGSKVEQLISRKPQASPETHVSTVVPTSPKEVKTGAPVKVETPEDVAFELHRTVMSHMADTEESLQYIKAAEKAGITKEKREQFRNYSEAVAAGETPQVHPSFKAEYDKWSGKLQTEITDTMKRMGVPAEEVVNNFSNRIAKNRAAWLGAIIEERPGQISGQARGGFARVPTSEKSRTVYSLGKAEDIITVKREEGKWKVTKWEDGEAISLGESATPITPGSTFNGYKVGQAKQADIEAHTPIKYIGDDLMVKSMLLNSLKKTERERQLLENIKESGLSQNYLVDSKTPHLAPEGYRELTPEAKNTFMGLREYMMPPQLAEVLEDFAGKYRNSGILDAVNNVIIKAMMINPFPHFMNEFVHWFDSRGLSGFVSPVQLTEASQGLQGLKFFPEAIKSVAQQDKFQLDLMREGGFLLYPSTKQQIAYKTAMQIGLKEVIKDAQSEPSLSKIANALGMPVGRFLSRVSDMSSTVMWASRDILYTQLVKEQMSMGKSMKEAIQETGKHMPEYYLPSRVLGSRRLSQTMQSPAFVFSRYHYGLLKALGENAKEVSSLGKDNKAFAKGLDHSLALVAGMSILYKGMDWMAQQMFSAPEAEQRRAGPYHLIEGIEKVGKGEKDYAAFMQSILTPNPAIMATGELMVNREAFTGKKILQPGMSPEGEALAMGEFAGSKIAPIQGLQKQLGGKETTSDVLARNMDIKLQRNKRKQAIYQKMNEVKGRMKEEELKRKYGIK